MLGPGRFLLPDANSFVRSFVGPAVRRSAKKTSTVGAKTSTKVSTTPVKTSTKVTTSNTKTPTRTTSSTSRSASKSTSRLSSTTTRIPSSTSKTATPTVIPSTTSRSATRTPTQTPTTSSTSKVSIPTTTAAVTGQATTTKLTTAAAQPTVSVQGPVGGDWVAAHNARRRNVTLGGPVPDIAYSNYLATEAAKWATKLASECKFYHPDNTWSFQSGQNLYVVWGGSSASFSSAETTIKAWADSEFPYYNNATGACSGGTCGHFTQVMWENTQYGEFLLLAERCPLKQGVQLTCNDSISFTFQLDAPSPKSLPARVHLVSAPAVSARAGTMLGSPSATTSGPATATECDSNPLLVLAPQVPFPTGLIRRQLSLVSLATSGLKQPRLRHLGLLPHPGRLPPRSLLPLARLPTLATQQ